MRSRKEILEESARTPFDLAIVGGGITGAGLLRDAARRGIRAVLFEKGDFAHGTTRWSSKLVHGGLRYLETYDWRLVFEASRERRLLLRLAPRLVRPLPFLFPVYRNHRNGLFKIAAGAWLYDVLSVFRNIRHPSIRGVASTLALQPDLRREGLTGSALYYDAVTHDVGLTMANLRSAWRDGGLAVNHAEVTEFLEQHGYVSGLRVRDGESGHSYDVRARWVVNATGPWSDRTARMAGARRELHLRLTKGVHLVLPASVLGPKHAVLMISPSDRRVTFLIPWEHVTLVGTTETDHSGDPDDASADRKDVDYLLDVVNFYFPGRKITVRDVISTFAGLRPLLSDDHRSPGKVSREHRIQAERPGLATIAGGKLTTYRKMAEELLDWLIVRTPEWRDRFRPCETHLRPLADAPEIPTGEETDPGEAVAGLGVTWREIQAAVRDEMATTVTDVLAGRTFLSHLDRAHALPIAPKVGRLLSERYGLEPKAVSRQLQDYLTAVRRATAGLPGGSG